MTVELEVTEQSSGDSITRLGERFDASALPTLGDYLKAIEEQESKKQSFVMPLGTLKAEGGYIQRESGKGKWERKFPIDEVARRSLGGFLNIPVPYLSRISTGLAEANIDYHFRQSPDAEAEFVVLNKELVEVKAPDSLMVTPYESLQVLNRVVGCTAAVKSVQYGLNSTVIDIVHPDVTIQPSRRVGDVTFGGLRVSLPKMNKTPEVGTYIHRLVCSNGAFTVDNGRDGWSIKGLTHAEILEHMEKSLADVWERVPEFLASYASLDDTPLSDPLKMVRVYAVEHGISPRFIVGAEKLVADFIAANPDYKWTMYDLMQVFTSLTHTPAAQENTKNKLMSLGGHMVGVADKERRCSSCAHLLDLKV